MYSYYTTSYNGRTIHIVKALADSNHDIQLSLLAYKYDTADPIKLASDFGDGYLESNGWAKVATINAGIFNAPYANGIEVSQWNIHENDDSSLDAVIGIGHDGSTNSALTIATQATLKSVIGSFRGAVTGAFGLIKDGADFQGNTSIQGAYSSLSGRSIVARGWDGALYFIATPGVTGSSGLTGAQCLDLVKNVLGLKDAVAMDGGGSVSLIYEGSWKVSTTRQIKNVFCIYAKQKSEQGGGGEDPAVVSNYDQFIPLFDLADLPHQIRVNGIMSPIKDIQVKMSNGLVSILDLDNI